MEGSISGPSHPPQPSPHHTLFSQNWFRYASTMRARSHFLLVTRVGAATMTAFYLLLACTGYWSLGSMHDLSKWVLCRGGACAWDGEHV